VAFSPPAQNSFFTFDQADVIIAFAKSRADHAQSLVDILPSCSEPDGLELDPASAEAFLERTVQKKDFLSMEVVGQYNFGFIIARKTSDSTDDLFVVDQHASDEKINFEDLQNNTVIQSQKLIRSVLHPLVSLGSEKR
jgi:DNA mismatch repair protein PMS2